MLNVRAYSFYRDAALAVLSEFLLMAGIALFLLTALTACGPSDAKIKLRKQAIVEHLRTLIEIDETSSTGSYIAGRSTTGPQHPSFIKKPYPTADQMQRAMGKADYDRAAETDDGAVRALNWWEPDPASEVYIGGGEGSRKGVHNVVTAYFDKDGILVSFVMLYNEINAAESIGRSTSDWKYLGP